MTITKGVGKEDEDKESGGDLAYARGEKNQAAPQVWLKVQGSCLLWCLVGVEGPGKTDAGGHNRPELKPWHIGEEAGDVLLQELVVVEAQQFG